MDKNKISLIIEIIVFIGILLAITGVYYFSGDTKKLEAEAESVGIIKITDDEFEKEVLSSKIPVILEFSSNNCPPCITMLPTMIEIAKNNKDIKVITVNMDDDSVPKLKREYGIEASPTFIIFKEGKVINKIVGATSEENLLKGLK